MKKTKLLLLFLLFLFIIPIYVNADMALPEIIPYKARVINKNGTESVSNPYEQKDSMLIPYDTLVEITFEENEYGMTNYNGKSCYIKLSDLRAVSEETEPVGEKVVSKKYYVWEEGAYLYKGPSKAYDKVDGNIQIKPGTTVTCKYSENHVGWGYVEYNGVKGWVYIYQCYKYTPYNEVSHLVDISEGNTKIYTLKDITLENSPTKREKTNIVVPAFTEVQYKYEYMYNPHKKYICIEYNGKEGWHEIEEIDNLSIAYNCKNKNISLIAVKDVPIYEKFNEENNNVIGTILAKEECDVIYASNYYYGDESWCYVHYNDISGWVNTKGEDYLISVRYNYDLINDNYFEYTTDRDFIIYDNVNGIETDVIIPKDTVLNKKYAYTDNNSSWWSYVFNDKYSGWIKGDFYKSSVENTSNENTLIENTNEINDENLAEEKENNIQRLFSIQNTLIICILVASIIAIISIFLIKKINSKENK